MITSLDGSGLRDFKTLLKSVKFNEPENLNTYTSSDEMEPTFVYPPTEKGKAQSAMGSTIFLTIVIIAVFNLLPVLIYQHIKKRKGLCIQHGIVFALIYTALSAAFIALSLYAINLSLYISLVAVPLGLFLLVKMHKAECKESLSGDETSVPKE